MANIKIDDNYKGVAAGVTDDANETIQPLKVNPATGALITDATVSVSTGTPVSIDWIGGVRQGGGSISVNLVQGSISTGTPVSLDWIGGVRQGGGSISVNLVQGSISTGTPVSLDWVGGIYQGGGSVSVNMRNLVAEDSGHITGDLGMAVWGVRNEGLDDFSGTDKDYIPFALDAKGHQFVRVSQESGENVLITSISDGTTKVSTGSIQLLNSYVSINGTVPVSGTFWQATQPVSFSSGSVQLISPNVTASGSIQLIPSQVFANQAGTWNITNLSGGSVQLISPYVIASQSGSYGVNVSTGSLIVNSGTVSLQGGNVAHDGADSGNPIKQGFRATTGLSALTMVADADRTDAFSGVDGVQIVRPHTNLEDIVSSGTTTTSTSTVLLFVAQGAGIKTYLSSLTFGNTSTSGTATVSLYDGNQIKYYLPVPPQGGITHNFPVPLGQTANQPWYFKSDTAITTLSASAIGFKSKI